MAEVGGTGMEADLYNVVALQSNMSCMIFFQHGED